MHKHDFIPKKIDEDARAFYSRCECGIIKGENIHSDEELRQLIEFTTRF